jgi:hypothetical protein
MVLSVRELLIRQRTQAINALRGHAAEFGVIAAKGPANVVALMERVSADPQIPQAARAMLAVLAKQVDQLDAEIAILDTQLRKAAATDKTACRLMAVPGIGPLSAITLSLTVDAGQFEEGRHFSSWLGLVPKQRSTGGRQRLGRISREGNERLRQLLVVGAMAVIRHAKPGSKSALPWLLKLLERRPRKLAAVALANKMARIVWAMMARGEAYRPRAFEAAFLFGSRSRNPSGPVAVRHIEKAVHMTASAPTSSSKHKALDSTGSFSNRASVVNDILLFVVAFAGSRFSTRSACAAATSGPKHRRCNVHNGLTCNARGPTASLAASLHPRPGGQLALAPAYRASGSR